MTSLAFYGGVNEIGGNKILLADKNTRIFLDFGMSFSLANKYFDEFMQPRKCNGIFDLVEFGLLPNLKGLYRCDYMQHCKCEKEKREFDAVLLTHAHMDHCSYIHYLREDIPIYCSLASRNIMQALDETSSTGTTELIWLRESFKIYVNKNGECSRLIGEKTKKERTYEIVEDGKKFKVGDIEIEPLAVNHSLEGATSYIIHTEKGPIIYTGDFRFHGYKGELTKKFVERATKVEPIALICEGTRIGEKETETEEQVKEKVLERVEKTKNLVVVNFPIRDTERMLSFHRVAKETNRALVINLKQAYLLKLFENSGISAPKIDDENIRIYIPRKGWGVFRDERFDDRIQQQDYEYWEREFLEHPNAITAREINKEQEAFIFRCDFFELKELIDIKPKKDSSYIRSICEPFDIEMELNLEKVENWLKHFGLFPYSQIHASGHLSGEELKEVIEEISPEKIFPVHTSKQEIFRELINMPERITLIEKGKYYEL
ncbi:MAG: MBL fold metallo-hydrolase [Candidatus Altiarchaeota archaeon]